MSQLVIRPNVCSRSIFDKKKYISTTRALANTRPVIQRWPVEPKPAKPLSNSPTYSALSIFFFHC